jgi:hypothetical protein
MKLEFVPASATPAFFIAAEQITQSLINYLNANEVYVHPPRHHLTQSGTEYYALEVQSGIPPKDGNFLASQFQPHQQH